jgi:DNA-binding transcriptional regulator GbsR (MarR family)
MKTLAFLAFLVKLVPCCIDEISKFLGISKGSASTNARFLIRSKFIKQVRVSGDRKDYYEFSGDLWPVLEESLSSFIRTQVDDFKRMNEQYLTELDKFSTQDKDDQQQCTHLSKQLGALNTLYKYLDIAQHLAKLFQATPVSKITGMLKKLVGKK